MEEKYAETHNWYNLHNHSFSSTKDDLDKIQPENWD